MKRETNNQKDNISNEEWKIVEERIKTMPDKMKLGILSHSFNKQELLLEVQNKSDIGRSYVEMQIEFIKWLIKQSKINQANQ